MKHKCPYTYPHRSRRSIIDYLLDHESYGGWNHPSRGWSPFSWNVKVYNMKELANEGEVVDPTFDEEWLEHLKGNQDLIDIAFEDARRGLIEGEYTTYPGDDQGDWEFCFGGRSGGHLILWKWRGTDLIFNCEEEFKGWLTGLSWDDLRVLYRGIRCMDHDFTQEKAEKEVNYQLNFQRRLFEEERCVKR